MSKIPEWFEMTSGAQSPEPNKPKFNPLKIAFIAIPLVLIGGAFVSVQEGDADDIPANVSTLSPSNTDAKTTGKVTSSNSSKSAEKSEGTSSANIEQSSSNETSGNINGGVAPSTKSIAQPKNFGVENEDGGEFGEHEGGDNEFGEHEGGEHRKRGH